ncbi:hypothetical protein Goshw_024556, partial [Gossypium schwendimanii]|nr:hypothetical protein [Gossypium schwendimanii]
MFDRLDKEVTLSLLEGGKVSYLVFSENYSPLKELVVTPRWCPMRSYINVETSTGSLYLEFGELLDIPFCSYYD